MKLRSTPIELISLFTFECWCAWANNPWMCPLPATTTQEQEETTSAHKQARCARAGCRKHSCSMEQSAVKRLLHHLQHLAAKTHLTCTATTVLAQHVISEPRRSAEKSADGAPRDRKKHFIKIPLKQTHLLARSCSVVVAI